jgi:hypothetical protein
MRNSGLKGRYTTSLAAASLLLATLVVSPILNLASAIPASAGVSIIGNSASSASTVDTYTNFTIVDTNYPALTAGWIMKFDYYAANTGPMAFVVVDASNTVQYVGPVFTPPGTGPQTWIPAVPIPVQGGWNVALYFGGSGGVIPFNYTGAPAAYTPDNNGLPTTGETLSIQGTSDRTYSFVATEETLTADCTGLTVSTYPGFSQDGPPIYVPSNSQVGVTGPAFTYGAAYKVESQGVYQFGSNPNWLADADWSYGYATPNSWVQTLGGSTYPPGDLNLMINGDSSINWGSYNPLHLYTHNLIGTGTPTDFGLGILDQSSSGTAYWSDNSGGLCVTVFEDNLPPSVSNIALSASVVPVNTSVSITATADDSSSGGSYISGAEYSVDGGSWTPMSAADGSFDSPTEGVTATNAINTPNPGVYPYDVCVRATDAAGNRSDETTCSSQQLVVYSPSGGFVTGGGWISSPTRACLDTSVCQDVTGKATFGFVSKYLKGASVPTGNTEFVFHGGGLNFSSTSYDWLVINQNGTNAQFKGTGTINGSGSYQFMIWANASNETFRIQITDGTAVVYDNGTQAIGGGSIIVHT